MKYINTFLILLISTLVLCAGCTTQEKAQAKILLAQTAKQVGQDLAIAAANTGTQLVNSQLAAASAKLQSKLDTIKAGDSVGLAKIQIQQAALNQAAKLTAGLQTQLLKLTSLDSTPTAPATSLTVSLLPPVTPPNN